MNPSRRSVHFATRLLGGAIGVLLAAFAPGCGGSASPEKAPPPPPPPPLSIVEADAPFVVDWDARQVASLADVVHSPSKGAVVVSYDRGVVRLLPDCHLSGVYVPSGIGMYRGMLQVRRADSRTVTAGLRQDALQQIATSANVPGGKLLDYRFVVVGRHHLGASRTSARVSDLSGRSAESCRGATHFVRAALAGAFERVLGPEAMLEARTLPEAGASQLPMRAGDFTQCLVAGTAGSPACAAFLKIELTALDPAGPSPAPTGTLPAPTGTLAAPKGTAPTLPITAPAGSPTVRPAGTTVQPIPTTVATIAVPTPPVSTNPVLIPVPKPPPPAATSAPSATPSAPPATSASPSASGTAAAPKP